MFFRPRIVEFGHARTSSRDSGQDLAQEVLMAVLGSLRKGQLREPEKLVGFVYGTARNLLNNQLRKQSRDRTVPLTADVEGPGSTVEDYEERDRERTVMATLGTLDRTDRSILSLSLVEGLKPGEIAVRLRLSGDMVRQRKSRLLKRLVETIMTPSQMAPVRPHTMVNREPDV